MTCSVEGCDRVAIARGWCKRHYYRWHRNGDPVAPGGPQHPITDPVVRFGRKYVIDEETGCWLWTASKHKDGYGWFGPGGRSRVILAHRWSYDHFVGEIPKGMYVLHRCDEPSCVNPDHLFLGTQADNVDDCARKGRRNQTRFKKLDAERHAEIRHLYATGEFSYAELGRRFGVGYQSIRYIVLRETA